MPKLACLSLHACSCGQAHAGSIHGVRLSRGGPERYDGGEEGNPGEESWPAGLVATWSRVTMTCRRDAQVGNMVE
jgi:hypothetical protein